MYAASWIMSSVLAIMLGVEQAAPTIHGIRAAKADLHLATATAASYYGLPTQADFTGI